MQERKFQTMNELAQLRDMPNLYTLRKLQKQGLLPGYFCGTRFYGDVDEIRKVLAALVRENGNIG